MLAFHYDDDDCPCAIAGEYQPHCTQTLCIQDAITEGNANGNIAEETI